MRFIHQRLEGPSSGLDWDNCDTIAFQAQTSSPTRCEGVHCKDLYTSPTTDTVSHCQGQSILAGSTDEITFWGHKGRIRDFLSVCVTFRPGLISDSSLLSYSFVSSRPYHNGAICGLVQWLFAQLGQPSHRSHDTTLRVTLRSPYGTSLVYAADLGTW